MTALAHWSFRHRRIVLGLWLALLIGLGALSAGVGTSYKDDFKLPATESKQALDILQRDFPAASGQSGQIVLHARTGTLRDPQLQQQASALFSTISRIPHVVAVQGFDTPLGSRQLTPDGATGYATVAFDSSEGQVPPEQVKPILAAVSAASTPQLQTEAGGQVFAEQPSPGKSELIGIAGAAIVLFIAFGSLLAMSLPLITAIVALGVGISAIGLLTHVLSIATFGPTLAALIGLGVGVDYALFIVTRHRSNLRQGMEVEASVVNAVDTAGRAVLFAGTIVCIALLGMFALGVSFLYGVAVSAALVVAFTMVAALTLLPALLGFYGVRVLSRRTRRKLAVSGPLTGGDLSPGWTRWGRFVQHHPVVLAALSGIVMLALAAPFLSMRLGSSDQGNDQTGTTTRSAYDLLAKGFGPGFNGPFLVVAELKGPADLPALGRVQQQLAATPGVAFVSPPQPSPNGKAAILQLIPKGSPQDESTSKLLKTVRTEVVPQATAGTDLQVHVGGVTAIFEDFASVLSSKLPLFIGVVVLLAFLLLAAVFRSVLVPLTASVMNLLAAGAAFGVVVAVFQWGWFGDLVGIGKSGPIEAFLPVMMFAILFGLSMDYEVFLVSRIHEEWLARRDNREAVTIGQAETGQVITAAAVIMVLVFGSFVLGGQRIIKEFGIGLAVAVLLDALLVRTVLVPSIMHLLGRSNWWIPRWLDKVLPRLHVEGSGGTTPEAVDPPEASRERPLEPTGA
ncbi:MAG: putative drug exporter of the superfamily [Frankiaceae bacterium]|nr:putative drug exporter of the superfamily [Frankiaceae bacterium]